MFQYLKDNKEEVKQLTQKGVIDPVWLRDIEMFEEFQKLNIKCVMCKYTILAERYELSEDTVRKRIKQMKIKL